MHGLSWIKAASVAILQPLINSSVGSQAKRIDGCRENSVKKIRKKTPLKDWEMGIYRSKEAEVNVLGEYED